MQYLIKSIITFFILFQCFSTASGQTTTSDSLTNRKIKDRLIAYYHAELKEQSPLYNGPAYDEYPRNIKGTAFLNADAWAKGSVYYDGVLFNNVPMRYDIFKDLVVVLLYNQFSSYSLISERIKYFDLSGHHFINISGDSTGIKTGFYDEVYDGPTKVLVKLFKSRQERTGDVPYTEFEDRTYYYLGVNNHYYEVSSEDEALKVLKNRKKEIQQFLRSSKIKFRKDKKGALISMASYYDKLNNK